MAHRWVVGADLLTAQGLANCSLANRRLRFLAPVGCNGDILNQPACERGWSECLRKDGCPVYDSDAAKNGVNHTIWKYNANLRLRRVN